MGWEVVIAFEWLIEHVRTLYVHTDTHTCIHVHTCACKSKNIGVRVPDMKTAATNRLGTVCVHRFARPKMFIKLSKCTKSRDPPCDSYTVQYGRVR